MTINSSGSKKYFQVVVMGGGGVGKSCLTIRLVQDMFAERYDPTIEDSYRRDNFVVDDVITPIEIMDTAGQDSFVSMRDLYYKSGHGFIFVFSIVDAASTEEVIEMFKCLLRTRGEGEDCPPVIIVGNKCDLEDCRSVAYEEGVSLAHEIGPTIGYIETSAKNDINVKKVFEDLVREIKKREVEVNVKQEILKKKKKKCTLL